MKRLPLLLAIGIIGMGIIVSGVVHHRNQRMIADQASVISKHKARLVKLEKDYRKFQDTTKLQSNQSPVNTFEAELESLRTEEENLQRRIKEIEDRHRAVAPADETPITSTLQMSTAQTGLFVEPSKVSSLEYQENLFKEASGEKGQPSWTGDARNLASAVRRYAREHDGQLPDHFEKASDYFRSDRAPPRIQGFELVYTGSYNDLTGIPWNAVALIRERQPWRSSNGKLARIYVMAGSRLEVVESDDNFQTWESAHIIPTKPLAD